MKSGSVAFAFALAVGAGCSGMSHPPEIVDGGPLPDRPHFAQMGHLRVTVLDDLSGLPVPSRVIVTAVAPTPPVRFDIEEHDHFNPDMKVNGEYAIHLGFGGTVLGAPEGVLLSTGDGAFPVPPGTYDLFLTRGPEYEAHTERVTITEHANHTVSATLARAVDTTGWLAADLHVHTGRSFDASPRFRTPDRVVTEVSVGVQIIAVTDHNKMSDLQPDVVALNYDKLARCIVGDEFNFVEGHGGAYPMPYDPTFPDDGGIDEYKLRWETVKEMPSPMIFDYMHSYPTRPALTVNHPRLPGLGMFTQFAMTRFPPNGWAPPTPLPDAASFDALEIMSGYMNAPDELAVLLRDWFFLVSSGFPITAVGSSDTHRLRDVKAGFPRTWLHLATDDVSKVIDSDLADALKSHHAIASNGPFVLLTVNSVAIGDLATVSGGEVTVDAIADAPSWIHVDKVRLFVNGHVAQEFAVPPQPAGGGQHPIFRATFKQKVPAGDGWILLLATGSKPLPEALIGDHEGGRVMPFAFTNPVYLDGDGDGQYHPRLMDADPGPLPALVPAGRDRDPLPLLDAPREPTPEDCEPPLWANPATWGGRAAAR